MKLFWKYCTVTLNKTEDFVFWNNIQIVESVKSKTLLFLSSWISIWGVTLPLEENANVSCPWITMNDKSKIIFTFSSNWNVWKMNIHIKGDNLFDYLKLFVCKEWIRTNFHHRYPVHIITEKCHVTMLTRAMIMHLHRKYDRSTIILMTKYRVNNLAELGSGNREHADRRQNCARGVSDLPSVRPLHHPLAGILVRLR